MGEVTDIAERLRMLAEAYPVGENPSERLD